MSRRRNDGAGALLAILVVAVGAAAWLAAKVLVAVLQWVTDWTSAVIADLRAEEPWRRRRGRLCVATVVCAFAALAGLGVVEAYPTQSRWHARFAEGQWFFALGALLVYAAFARLVWRYAAEERSWSGGDRHGIPGAAVVGALVAVVTLGLDQPGLAVARGAYARGEMERARIEAEALLGGDEAGGAREVLDGVHAREVEQDEDVASAAERLDAPWYAPSHRAEAASALSARVEAAARAAWSSEQVAEAGRLADLAARRGLACAGFAAWTSTLLETEAGCGAAHSPACAAARYDEAQRANLDPRVVGASRQRCVARLRAVAATPTAGATHAARATALRRERAALTCLARFPEAPPGRSVATVDAELADADREAAAETDREARVVARREREEERASRRNAGRVLCCDGSYSPSCGCARSSFRGCCSRHGGICGGC